MLVLAMFVEHKFEESWPWGLDCARSDDRDVNAFIH